jgi:hypothetical protein
MKKKNNNKPDKNRDRMLSLFPLDEENEHQGAGEPGAFAHLPGPPLPPVTRPAASAPDLADGRDELNLAEFPLTLLSDRSPAGVDRLTFTDVVYDSGDAGRPAIPSRKH